LPLSYVARVWKLCAAVFAALAVSAVASAQTAPELPRSYVDTSPVAVTGRIITVSAGGSVQAAIDQAIPGDAIVLQAGATFTGPIRLRNKAGSGWITIRSSAESQLPAGQRVTPGHASLMPKIVTTGAWAALETDAGAHHYRIVGIEFAVASGVQTNYGVVTLGRGDETQLSQLPHNIVFERVYVHGQRTGNVRRGLALNSAWTAVVDSYVNEIHEVGADTQAIGIWNGPGPFKIVNNHLEAAGENILIGGVDPRIQYLVPSDIEIRRNTFYKPLSWRQGDPAYAGTPWTVKNIFELKNAQRVLVQGNHFEHNWAAAQNGFSILLTVRNQQGTAPWSVVQDITFDSNLVQRIAAAFNILGRDDTATSQSTRRVRITNNLFVDVGSRWGGNGRLFQVLDGVSDLWIEHNTAVQSGEFVYASGAASYGFVFRNNLVNGAGYGLAGDGTFGSPTGTLTRYFPGGQFLGNGIVAGVASLYPTGNLFPVSFDAVAFVGASSGDYRLSSYSPLKGAATDGKDIGVDFAAFSSATSGTSPTPTAPSGGGTSGGGAEGPPTVSVTSPAAGATVSGIVTLTASATDNVGVAGVQFYVDAAPVGSEDLSAPYSLSWNSTAVSNGAHTIRADARDAAGNYTSSSVITVNVSNGSSSGGTTISGAQAVTWTRARNAQVSGGSIFKSGGCDGCPDAGASSSQAIGSGLGYVEFTVGVTTASQVIGLSNGDSDLSEEDVDFALKFWPGGGAEVRLRGVYQGAEIRAAVGDVFRIAVSGTNVVTFSKNGVPFHSVSRTVTYPLLVDVSLLGSTGRFLDAKIGGGTSDSPTSGTGGTAVSWTQMMNVAMVNGVLTKVGGCSGCEDGGAVSAQSITSGSGYVEFRAPDSFGQRVIGLSAGSSGTGETDIDFGLKFWAGGGVDVRENGSYVGVDTRYTSTDVFRIAVASGAVTYYKNGQVLYRSRRAPGSTLVVDTSFVTMSTGLGPVTIAGAN
jgi:hypothetical protein